MTLITTPTLTKSTPRTLRTVRNCLVHQKSSTGNSICRSKAKIPAQMLHLQGSQMLQMLEKSLRKGLPESLKVYGTVFHMNQGNPFKLKALVDKWPDFNTVVVRPQEKEMTDDLDHYTNTYQIYSKDPKNCQEFLGSPEVINWKQHLQIQTKKLVPSLLDAQKLSPDGAAYNSTTILNQEMFKLSSLDVTHAALVDKFWSFGGNEKSQRFIKRCIQNFPTFCVLGPEGTPVSWDLMDQTGELRMAGTMPEYRRHGLVFQVIRAQVQALEKFNFPMYSHVDRANHAMRKVCFKLSFVPMPADWNQWKYEPL
ncbi:glycine N-acyltransferase-like isoform X2 [Saccopteryx bilineata]|uniref:glycine N-acyltransferase-like isoform X2 n=1 Tax=Saccopteryx bilineata TaxID=59482 RepID=UPI0033901623